MSDSCGSVGVGTTVVTSSDEGKIYYINTSGTFFTLTANVEKRFEKIALGFKEKIERFGSGYFEGWRSTDAF